MSKKEEKSVKEIRVKKITKKKIQNKKEIRIKQNKLPELRVTWFSSLGGEIGRLSYSGLGPTK